MTGNADSNTPGCQPPAAVDADRADGPDRPDKSQVAAGAGLVSAGRMLTGLFNLLTLIFLARLLTKSLFALVVFVYLIQETARALGSLGLPAALYYFVPKLGQQSARSLGVWISVLLMGLALPWSIVLLVAHQPLATVFDKPALAGLLVYLSVYLLADFPTQALAPYMLSRKRYLGYFLVMVLFGASRFASLVIPAAWGATVRAIMFWFVAVCVGRWLIHWGVLLVVDSGTLSRCGWRLKEVFSYGIPLSLSLSVNKLNRQIDKYMIAGLCAAEVFAVYSVGAIEIPLVPGIAYSVTAALIPTLVVLYDRRDDKTFVEYWHGAMTKVAAIMMPVFVFFFVLAEPAMRVLFSSGYSEAAIPFRIYLCLLPLRLCGYGAVVRSMGKTRPVLISAVAALVVNAGLNYPLYLLLGMAGPALATVLGQVTAVLILLAVIRKKLAISAIDVFPLKSVVRVLLVALLCGVPLWVLAYFMEGDLLRILVGAVVFVVLYLIAGRVLGVLSAADFSYLKDLATLRVVRKSRRGAGEGAKRNGSA